MEVTLSCKIRGSGCLSNGLGPWVAGVGWEASDVYRPVEDLVVTARVRDAHNGWVAPPCVPPPWRPGYYLKNNWISIDEELIFECSGPGWSASREPAWNRLSRRGCIRDGELTWRYAGRLKHDVQFLQKLGAVLYVPCTTPAGPRLGCAYSGGVNVDSLRLSYLNLDGQTKLHHEALPPGKYNLYVFSYLTQTEEGNIPQAGNIWAWGEHPRPVELKTGSNAITAYLNHKL